MTFKEIVAIAVLLVVIVIAAFFASLNPSTGTVPESNSAGKIDISAVCEGALAYMTFIDGAAADKFVAECREGKHPDVIERYLSEMNLGGGAAI